MSQEKGFSDKDSWNLAFTFLSGQAMGVACVTRRGFGGEYIGMQGLVGFVVLMIWIALRPSYLEAFVLPYILVILAHRVRHFINLRRGIVRHSRYVGDTWLTGWVCKDQRIARILEGIVVAAAGAWLAEYYRHEGNFVGMSGLSIIVLEVMYFYIDGKKERAMLDAQIEMAHFAESLQRKYHF